MAQYRKGHLTTKSWDQMKAVCPPMSLAPNLAVLGAGSIVSATRKGAGSVSADLPGVTDVLLASGLFILAIVSAAVLLQITLRSQRGV